MRPAEVFPPAEYLRDEMAARGLTQTELAKMTGRDRGWISRVVTGRYPIGPSFALDLEAALGTSAEMWCRLQADWNVHLARKAREARCS